jgi:hypothetical protein
MPDLTQITSKLSEKEKRVCRDSLSIAYSTIFDTLMRGAVIEEEINNYHMTIKRNVWNTKFTGGKHRYEIKVNDNLNRRVLFYRTKEFDKFFAQYLITRTSLQLNSAAV